MHCGTALRRLSNQTEQRNQTEKDEHVFIKAMVITCSRCSPHHDMGNELGIIFIFLSMHDVACYLWECDMKIWWNGLLHGFVLILNAILPCLKIWWDGLMHGTSMKWSDGMVCCMVAWYTHNTNYLGLWNWLYRFSSFYVSLHINFFVCPHFM